MKIARFDNAREWTSSEVRALMEELGVKIEFTSPGGPKLNGRVERRLALIAEGAKSAWVELPHRFPGVEFLDKLMTWTKIWAEFFCWMNERINMTAVAHATDKRCPYEKMYGKLPPYKVLPCGMPGYRHRLLRDNKMQSKGEICFYLNSGNEHSSTTFKVLTEAGNCAFSSDVTFGLVR